MRRSRVWFAVGSCFPGQLEAREAQRGKDASARYCRNLIEALTGWPSGLDELTVHLPSHTSSQRENACMHTNSHIHFHGMHPTLHLARSLSCQHCRTVYCYCGNQTAGLQCLASFRDRSLSASASLVPRSYSIFTGPRKVAQDTVVSLLSDYWENRKYLKIVENMYTKTDVQNNRE